MNSNKTFFGLIAVLLLVSIYSNAFTQSDSCLASYSKQTIMDMSILPLDELNGFFVDSNSKSVILKENSQIISFGANITLIYKELQYEQLVDEDGNEEALPLVHLTINDEEFYLPVSKQGSSRLLVYHDLVFKINTIENGTDIQVSSYLKNEVVIYSEYFQYNENLNIFLIKAPSLRTIESKELIETISDDEFEKVFKKLQYFPIDPTYPDGFRAIIKEFVKRNLSMVGYVKCIENIPPIETEEGQEFCDTESFLLFLVDPSNRMDFAMRLYSIDDLNFMVETFPKDKELMLMVKDRLAHRIKMYSIKDPNPSGDLEHYRNEYHKCVELSKQVEIILENLEEI
jgi:hypothetical protein